MNPAIGAFILSDLDPSLRIKHKISLYEQVKTVEKTPNLAESVYISNFDNPFNIFLGFVAKYKNLNA